MSSKFDSSHINIVLDSAPQGKFGTFIPGQTVSGTAIYNPITQVDIDVINMIFKGICYSEVKERHSNGSNGSSTKHYREKIVLFRSQETLFRGPRTIQSARHEWPFSFTLPEGADYRRKEHASDSQYQLGPQSLPPSFKLRADNRGLPPEAHVSYQLKVKVNPGRMLHSAEHIKEITVAPVSSTPLKDPWPLDGPCQGDGRFKSKALRPVQHSFKEKMSHIFTSDPSLKTPEINIAVSFKMPRSVGISQKLPIEVSCKHWRTGENDPEKPNLVLRDCHITLKAYTNVRAESTFRDHSKEGKQTKLSHHIRCNNLPMPLDGSFVPITEPLCLADMTNDKLGLIPNFKTFTIAMSYKMTAKLSIRHVGLGHVWEFESKVPFEILPENLPIPAYAEVYPAEYVEPGPSALYPPQLPPDGQASSSTQAPPIFQESAAPPSYDSGEVWHNPVDEKRVF